MIIASIDCLRRTGVSRSCVRSLILSIRLLGCVLVLAAAASAQPCSPGDYLCEKEPKRVALVIGNANYANFGSIPSSITDAETMRQRLTELGFDVEFRTDVHTPFQFWEEILPAFRQKLTSGDFIVFYFSGHGFAYGRDNLIVPTDFPRSLEAQHITDHAIAVDSFKAVLETHSPGLLLFIIDACSSIGKIELTNGTKNLIAKGPASMENRNTSLNSIIAYATEPGHEAIGSSAPGQLSAFTGALNGHLATEGSPISVVFKEVAADLVTTTMPPQVPGTFDWSRTDPYLKPSERNIADQKEAWLSALNSGIPQRVKVFAQRYSVSRHLNAAQRWIADHPNSDLTSGFTRASPVAIDRAWRANAEMVAIRRLSVPLGFMRSFSADQITTPRNLSDAEIGLVKSGVKQQQIAEMRTGEEFVASISPRAVHGNYFRNSMAYSLANIDAHQTMVATRPLLGRVKPKLESEVIANIPIQTVLQIKDVTIGEDEGVWIQATGAAIPFPFYFKLEPGNTPEVLELGRSVKEILVPPRSGSVPDLVDPVPIRAALAALKAQGWKITWISLSTAATVDEAEQETRAARMANAEFILKHSDVPLFISGPNSNTASRITSVSGREDFSGDFVRIRFFGIR
ncbi:MAG: caspase family protein [Acidobacteriota bacterium]